MDDWRDHVNEKIKRELAAKGIYTEQIHGTVGAGGVYMSWELVTAIVAAVTVIVATVAYAAYRYGNRIPKLRRVGKATTGGSPEGERTSRSPSILSNGERSMRRSLSPEKVRLMRSTTQTPDSPGTVAAAGRMETSMPGGEPVGPPIARVLSMPVFDKSSDNALNERSMHLGYMNAMHPTRLANGNSMSSWTSGENSFAPVPELSQGESVFPSQAGMSPQEQKRTILSTVLKEWRGAAASEGASQTALRSYSGASPSLGPVKEREPIQTLTLSGEGQDIPLVNNQRYHSEFVEREKLGKGGFGTVYQGRNRLDGRDYAIKKIRLSSDLRCRPQLEKVLREVKILALLDHKNIVRYYQAWLEKMSEGDLAEEQERDSAMGYSSMAPSGMSWLASSQAGSVPSTPRKGESRNPDRRRRGSGARHSDWTNPWSEIPSSGAGFSDRGSSDDEEEDGYCVGGSLYRQDSAMSIPGFEFDRSTPPEKPTRGVTGSTRTPSDTPNREKEASAADGGGSAPSSLRKGHRARGRGGRSSKYSETMSDGPDIVKDLWLYIQMQYCSHNTLQFFLEQREKSSKVDMARVLQIFLQVAKGLTYVHGTGLIHRDLKPANCFLLADGTVKIGDFGLSRHSSVATAMMLGGAIPGASDTGSSTSSPPKRGMGRSKGSTGGDITAGVGTLLYASPEQLSGRDYDAKTDIYSLGMMLFEMSHPAFTTLMERTIVLSNAHKLSFPEEWSVPRDHPEIEDLVLRMLQPLPKSRPSAAEVVRGIESMQGKHMVLELDYFEEGTQGGDGDGIVSVVLRVEAEEKEGLLHRLVKEVRQLCEAGPGTARLEQYGLRGLHDHAIIEFLIGGATLDERQGIIAELLKLQDVRKVKEFPAVSR